MVRFILGLVALLGLTGAAGAAEISESDRQEVIANAAKLLEQRYVDPELGKRLAGRLHRANGNWNRIVDPKAFADAVTQWLRRVSGDGHLGIRYSPEAIPEASSEGAFAGEMERWYGTQVNHGVERIERLPGNIMLLDLRVFPPPAMAADVFASAMTVVAQGNALIIDLRNNGGGAETANLLMGYVLPGGSPLAGTYDRPSNMRRFYSSPDWVPGRRFGDSKPLYVLVSRKTFSAAEAVAYNLQSLKRATIIGERTGGGAHPFEFRRIHPHFALDLPEGKSIHPVTGRNWQGVGVRPDVELPAEQALERAIELARAAVTLKS